MLALFLYQNPPAATPMQNKLILRYLSRLCLIIKKLYGNACFHIACLFSLKFLLFLIFSLFSSLALSTTAMPRINQNNLLLHTAGSRKYIFYSVRKKQNCTRQHQNSHPYFRRDIFQPQIIHQNRHPFLDSCDSLFRKKPI